VRPYYLRRVTLFGAESTGKTTLSAQLARHFDTVVAPEYGRFHTEAFGCWMPQRPKTCARS
jgi:HTH-type transcriptional repressor of NAD biosynthesis genes